MPLHYPADHAGQLPQAPREASLFRPAVYGILIENHQVLLLRPLSTAAWQLPGEIVQPGEMPAQALRQSVWSAAGFVPEVGPVVFVEDQYRPEGDHMWQLTLLYFELRRPEAPYAMIDFDRAAGPEWVSLNMLQRDQLQWGWDAVIAAQARLRLP